MKTKAELSKLDESQLVEIISDLSDKLDADLQTTGGKDALIKVILDNQGDSAPQEKATTTKTAKAKKPAAEGDLVEVKAKKTIQGADYVILKDKTGIIPAADLQELLDRDLVEEI